MKRIGIMGENYDNDACAFAALLSPQYQGQVLFIPILKSLKGGYDNVQKVIKLLPTEIRKNKLDAIICTHDLDEHAKQLLVNDWFTKINNAIDKKAILFLAVMEMEALILADIETFNNIYKVSIFYTKNPLFEADPKKLLKEKTSNQNRYHENHAEDIFAKLQFDKVYKNHAGLNSFSTFIDAFEERFKLSRNKNKK